MIRNNALRQSAVVAFSCAVSGLAGVPASEAQSTFEADFENTFPSGGYSYAFSGYGDASCVNNVTDDQVSSSFDILTGPAATADFDATGWTIPGDACYNYAGWGLGVIFDIPESRRATSADLSQYNVSFDAAVAGFESPSAGIESSVSVIFQIEDNNGDNNPEELRIGISGDDLGNVSALPFLNETPQSFSYNLADFAVQNSEFDFAAEISNVLNVLLQVQPNTNADQIGFDTDNVVTLDNVQIAGPFAEQAPGDFDGDGDVDGADFKQWQRGNSPNGVGSGDLGDWETNFGQPTNVVTAIPEPSVLAGAFAVLAILAPATSRSRRQ